MGIFIRSVKMPKNCDKCPLHRVVQDGDKCRFSREGIIWRQSLNEKPDDWCDLVEVAEPHDRLIEAEKVIKAFIKRLGIKSPEYLYANERVMIKCIEEAPTIIDAEELDIDD